VWEGVVMFHNCDDHHVTVSLSNNVCNITLVHVVEYYISGECLSIVHVNIPRTIPDGIGGSSDVICIQSQSSNFSI